MENGHAPKSETRECCLSCDLSLTNTFQFRHVPPLVQRYNHQSSHMTSLRLGQSGSVYSIRQLQAFIPSDNCKRLFHPTIVSVLLPGCNQTPQVYVEGEGAATDACSDEVSHRLTSPDYCVLATTLRTPGDTTSVGGGAGTEQLGEDRR